jgi:DNA-binding beta-propeller fold protein YncE
VSVAEELQPGDPERIGPYRVISRLGRGGMGRVFLGRSAGGRPVAVKVIRADLAADREFRARFRREVDAARKVSGLYTAPLVDADLDGPTPWLATAYVPGPSLADAVAAHGPLPPASVLMLAAGLAESLTAIHAAGVVHRDLKPANVLLADDGPRVIDFGISRAAEASSLTLAGLVVGSPGFMSPEQAEGGEVGPPSDVFSLGAVLMFAATGHGPFGAGSTAALVYRVVHGTPALDDVSAELRALVERCLAKEPSQRPTARDLLAELGETDVPAGWLPTSAISGIPWQAGTAAKGPVAPGIEAQPTVTRVREPAAASTGSRPAGDRLPQARHALVATLADPASQVVYAVAFSPDGRVLAAADGNGRAYLCDVASGELALAFGDPYSHGVMAVAFDPDSELLAAADGNGRVYLWDVVSRELARTFVHRRTRGVNGVAFGRGGDVLAAADGNGRVYLWDVITGESVGSLVGPGSQGMTGVAISPGGDVISAADGNGRVYLWDLGSSEFVRSFVKRRSQGVNGVAFGPSGDVLAAADGNGRVYLWDVSSGELVRTLAAPDSQGVNGVTFGPSGDVLAAADGNGRVYLWDVMSGEQAEAFGGPGSRGVNGVAFSPDGELLAAADGNGCTYLWQAKA